MSVAKLGGLPCMSSPMRKTFAVNQIDAKTEPIPIKMDSQICHHGGGVMEAMRISIANVFMGGMRLMAVLNAEFGSREIGNESM